MIITGPAALPSSEHGAHPNHVASMSKSILEASDSRNGSSKSAIISKRFRFHDGPYRFHSLSEPRGHGSDAEKSNMKNETEAGFR